MDIKISVRGDFMNKKKSKRIVVKIISATLIIVLFVSSFTAFSKYTQFEYCKKHDKMLQYLDDSEAKTFKHIMTFSEMKEADLIVADIRKALNYSGSRADCDIPEQLTSFCRFTDDYDYISVQSSVNLITYKKVADTGYLWIRYSYKNLGEDDIVVTGAREILCLIIVKETADGYEITDILQGP